VEILRLGATKEEIEGLSTYRYCWDTRQYMYLLERILSLDAAACGILQPAPTYKAHKDRIALFTTGLCSSDETM